jgi:hypothetical protein
MLTGRGAQAGLFRRRNIGAAAHAGHQFRGGASDLAEHFNGLADRIDPGADPGDLGRIGLIGLLDMDLKGVAWIQPSEPTRRRDQLDLEAAVVEDFQQRLARRRILELLRLLLEDLAARLHSQSGRRSVPSNARALRSSRLLPNAVRDQVHAI